MRWLADTASETERGADAVHEALRERRSFNIIDTCAEFKVDVFVQEDRPFERSALERWVESNLFGSGERPVWLLTAEDVILFKLERYRPGGEVSDQQWFDVLGVLRTQAGRLDEAYLDHWSADLGVSDLLGRARGEVAPDPHRSNDLCPQGIGIVGGCRCKSLR